MHDLFALGLMAFVERNPPTPGRGTVQGQDGRKQKADERSQSDVH
jgi:hypothetical protein